MRIKWTTIEIGYFNRMIGVGKVHNRHTTLVPGLYFYVPAGNRNERAVVCHTVLGVALRRRQLVVARKTQLVAIQTKHSVGAPFIRIVGTATRTQSASPLIREHDLCPIVRK